MSILRQLVNDVNCDTGKTIIREMTEEEHTLYLSELEHKPIV